MPRETRVPGLDHQVIGGLADPSEHHLGDLDSELVLTKLRHGPSDLRKRVITLAQRS